jgi:hypothetical protein
MTSSAEVSAPVARRRLRYRPGAPLKPPQRGSLHAADRSFASLSPLGAPAGDGHRPDQPVSDLPGDGCYGTLQKLVRHSDVEPRVEPRGQGVKSPPEC